LIEAHDIHLERERSTSELFDFGGQAGVGGFVAEAERDVCTGLRERDRDGAAEAASGSGDQGDLASEVEIRRFGHSRILSCWNNRSLKSVVH
jgi:hypothetical protein